jgi:hypothetical protein
MNTNKKGNPLSDRPAEKELREETNKPAPLFNKTDRNFQRQNQGPQDGTSSDPVSEDKPDGSSSDEEKDII